MSEPDYVIERTEEAEAEPAEGWRVLTMAKGYTAWPDTDAPDQDGVRPTSKWFPRKAQAIAYTFGRDPVPACRIVVDGCAPLPVLHAEAIAIRDELDEWLRSLPCEDPNLVPDRRMECDRGCGKVPHRFRPSPEAGPHWRCSECGEVTEARTPDPDHVPAVRRVVAWVDTEGDHHEDCGAAYWASAVDIVSRAWRQCPTSLRGANVDEWWSRHWPWPRMQRLADYLRRRDERAGHR